MKIRVSPSVLQDTLLLASTVAPVRATIPALSCLRLEARGPADAAGLTVSATDMELGIQIQVPLLELEREGTLVVPAGRFAQLIREVRDSEIEISADQMLGLVKTSDGRFKIVGMDPSDYPAFPEPKEAQTATIPARDLKQMIEKSAFAVSTESVRYALTGQLLDIRDGETRMVASDGRRLSYVRRVSTSKKGPKVIVPTKTFQLLLKALTPEDETVEIHTEENSIRFATRRALLTSRVIEGTFPDYEQVIPKGGQRTVTVEVERFRSALRRTSLLSRDRARSVKLTLEEGKLTLFSRSEDLGEATVEIPAEYAGPRFEIVFNPDYILDYLRTVENDRVSLTLKDQQSAGLFKASDDHLYVLMPLALDSL